MTESVLKHPGFFRFWVGETISYFGSAITMVALPLTAVLILDADEEEMGLLTALGTLPFLLIGLPAGVWVDTRTRRPILIGGSLIRGLLLATIPIAVTFDGLTMAQLQVVNFAVACAMVVEFCAHRAYLPGLVGRDRLTDANSRLSISHSVAETAGPGVAGVLVKLLSAPLAILVDAISYLVAALMFASIRDEEQAPIASEPEGGIRERILNGIRTLWNHRDLRAVMLCGTMHNICSTAIVAIFILYATKSLALGPEHIGIIFACGGVGAVAGGALAPGVERRLGTRGALVFSQVLTGIARLMIPLAAGSPTLLLATLCASQALLGVARPIFNVVQLSLRGRVVADHLQGRVTASFGFLMWGFTPLGALAGGILGGAMGLRPTLLVASIGVFLATGWLLAVRSEVTTPESETFS